MATPIQQRPSIDSQQPNASTSSNQQSTPFISPGNSLDRNYYNSLKRTISRVSKRSYASNLSSLNRRNISRFGKAKIVFLIFNAIFAFIAIAVFLTCILTYAETFSYAPLLKFTLPSAILPLATVGSLIMTIVAFIGFLGAFAHRKPILTVFNISCWVVLALFIAVGYLAYKDVNTSQFENDLALKWDEWSWQRGVVETKFNCCGYYSIYDRAYQTDKCAASAPAPPVAPAPTTTTTTLAVPTLEASPSPSPSPEDGGEEEVLRRRVALHRRATSSCHVVYASFALQSIVFSYVLAFTIVPYVLVVFIVSMLVSNHIYD